jgi:purine nucleoside permease
MSNLKRHFRGSFIVGIIAAAMAGTCSAPLTRAQLSSRAGAHRREVRVMIVTMFGLEAKVWLDHLGPWDTIRIPGLSPDYPDVHCNRQSVCVMTTDMGHANAAASIMALTFSDVFDLRKTYFLVTGIAGIDPMQGTLGSPAWARYLVDFGLQWEIDSREKPAEWPSGFIAIGASRPEDPSKFQYHTEVFELNAKLADIAFALSKDVPLADSSEAKATRAKYKFAPANQPPRVVQCDTLTADTWWAGNLIGERARVWTKQLTHGKGTYCTTQQEDNATYAALMRAASAGRVDAKRVAVLRAGSDFDQPHEGQSAFESLSSFETAGGVAPAIENLYRTGLPLITNINENWQKWRDGVPDRLP